MINQALRRVKNKLWPPINISDEYIDLLAAANGGWLDRGNLHAIDHALKKMPGGAIVEIGIFAGLSTNVINYYRKKNGVTAPLFNCDKWVWGQSDEIGESGVTYTDYLAFTKATYVRSVETFSKDAIPHTIAEFSDDFFELWRKGEEVTDVFGQSVRLGGPIGFCFIDGNHDYEFAKRDFDHADEFLLPGGFILFDDSSDGTKWGVGRARDEVMAAGRYEVVMKNPNYLFRKK